MSIKKRSAANQAIVEMLKEQQQQNNDSLNSSAEKSESQKNLEKESKKEMEQYKNSKEYQRKESIKERTEFKNKLKSYLMESWLNYVFEHSLGNRKSVLSEDVLNLNKSLIKTFVNEEGVDSLLTTMSYKSNLLAEVAKYINEAVEEELKEYDKEDTAPTINADLQNNLYDKLDGSQDFEEISDTIRERVSLATQNFIQKNMVDKLDIKEIMNNTKERLSAVRTGDDEKDEQISHEQTVKMKRAIKEINNRPHSIFEQLVINLTEQVISDPKIKEKFTTESGRLDMDGIVDRSISMYTMLEMVNALQLKDMDHEYIQSVIGNK